MVYMRDYRYHPGDSLHPITTHNRLPLTLLYPTPTNTHDIPRDNDSEQDQGGIDQEHTITILAIAS